MSRIRAAIGGGLLAFFSIALAAADETGDGAQRPYKLVRAWPLLHIEHGPGDRRATDALFSLYHMESDAFGTTRRVAPFYFAGSDTRSQLNWSLVVPLYYRKSDADSSAFITLPFAAGRNSVDGSRWWQAPLGLSLYRGTSALEARSDRAGLFPLVDLVGRSRTNSGTRLDLLGLFAWGDPGESLLPIYRLHTNEHGTVERSSLFPIYFYRNSDGENWTQRRWFLPPLGYWRETTSYGTHQISLLALGDLWQHDTEYRWHALLGLWGGGHTTSGSWLRVEPFLSYERDDRTEEDGAIAHAGAFNALHLFGREWDESTGLRGFSILSPLVYFGVDRFSATQRIFPFYFAGRTGSRADDATSRESVSSYRLLFPLYYQRRHGDWQRRWLTPIYYSDIGPQEGTRVGFPFYWHEWSGLKNESLHVLPVYSRLKNARETWDLFAGPLYVRHQQHASESAPSETSHSVLWPLIGYRWGAGIHHSHVLPVWWSTREPGFALDLLAPLYLRVATQAATHFWIVPVYGSYRRALEAGRARVSRFFAAGAVIHNTTTNAADIEVGRALHLLGPLAGYRSDSELSEFESHFFPFWYQSHASERATTCLFPLYYGQRRGRGENADELRSFAGIWYERTHAGETTRGLLYPLARWSQTPRRERLDIFGVFGRRAPAADGAGESRWRLSPLVYAASDARREHTASWFHLYSQQRGDWGDRSRLMPFLYDKFSSAERRRVDLAFSLVRLSGTRDGSLSENWALPFYYHRREQKAGVTFRETLALTPLYFQTDDGVSGTSSKLLLPFCYTESAQDDSSARRTVFPLFDYRRDPLGTSLLTPLTLHEIGRDSEARTHAIHLLARDRRLASDASADGLWSRDGYGSLRLVNHVHGATSHTWTLNPLAAGYHFDAATDTTHVHGLLGLVSYSRTGDASRYWFLGPVQGGSDAASSWHSTFPLYYRERRANELLPRVSAPALFHLYARTEDHEETRWSTLFHFAGGYRKKNDQGDWFRVLYRFISFGRAGQYRERVVEPFFTYEHDGATGEHYYSVLKFLYIDKQRHRDAPRKRRILGIIPI